MLLEQGTNFYVKLNDILTKLQQSINDYKFSRDIQKNELISGRSMSVQSQPGAGGPPGGGMPGMGAYGNPGQPMQPVQMQGV